MGQQAGFPCSSLFFFPPAEAHPAHSSTAQPSPATLPFPLGLLLICGAHMAGPSLTSGLSLSTPWPEWQSFDLVRPRSNPLASTAHLTARLNRLDSQATSPLSSNSILPDFISTGDFV